MAAAMARRLWIVLGLVACEPPLRIRALPELVAQDPAIAIAVPALQLVPGEALIWDVHVQGFTIGRAELVVSEHRVHSRFATSSLVRSFANVRHELTTILDRGGARPIHASDALDVEAEHTRVESAFDGSRVETVGQPGALVVPGGNIGHTLHTALGALRAWASPRATAGYLYVAHAGELFRLDFAQPVVEDTRGTATLRIEGRVRATPNQPAIAMTIWLRAIADHAPLRFEVRSADVKLTAELIASDAR